ncbi:MAG TPA: tripartite tricarboxylate transporter substrate binding protein [Usitatibacter sp.]|jgi:tripartite-type tricarboxylate transporter receptor subunit TctC|nr:tripartite tricarboxylate transporter substrate binding protein [Usitatibacter sp.]
MIRRLLAFIAALATTAALAQGDYPNKPIKLIVPFPPAGGTDTLSRAIAQSITNDTKWTIVVENRPGAGGNIGLDAAAKSPPDGYTIAMGQTANLAVNPALYSSLPFDPLKDFAPIALLSSQPLIVVVSATSPYKSLKDLVDAAKKNPGKVNMASAGNGTIGHIGGEIFQRRAGIKMTHVPYKGAGQAVTDLMGGSVDTIFGNTQSVGGLVAGGRLRPLAVTSPKRLAAFPDVPTVAESGYPGFEAATWSGLVAPAGTPKPIIDKLNAAANRALASAEIKAKLGEDGSTPLGGTPQQFADYIKSENAKWGAAVRDAGIKLD